MSQTPRTLREPAAIPQTSHKPAFGLCSIRIKSWPAASKTESGFRFRGDFPIRIAAGAERAADCILRTGNTGRGTGMEWNIRRVPNRVLDWYRRGLGVAWIGLAVGLGSGFNAWHRTHYAILHSGDGLRVPWREVAWLPVWSPLPSGSMAWLLALIGILAVGLVVPWRPRLCAAAITVLWLWLMGLDQFLFLYHRYFLLCATVCLLLLPSHRERHVSLTACLPLIVLVAAVWFWSGWAKISPFWLTGGHLRYDMTHLTVPWQAVRFAQWTDRQYLILAWFYLAVEILMAYLVVRPRTARFAAWASIPLAVTLAPLAPVFATAFGVASWTAGQCVAHRGLASLPAGETRPVVPRWRVAAIGLFCVWQVLLPARPYLLATDPYDTGQGLFWAWRQMALLRTGEVRIETLTPGGWHDIVPALDPLHDQARNHLSLYPCQTAWAVAWWQDTRPDLLPPERPVRVRHTAYPGERIPGECATPRWRTRSRATGGSVP